MENLKTENKAKLQSPGHKKRKHFWALVLFNFTLSHQGQAMRQLFP